MRSAVVVAGRFFVDLGGSASGAGESRAPVGPEIWGETSVALAAPAAARPLPRGAERPHRRDRWPGPPVAGRGVRRASARAAGADAVSFRAAPRRQRQPGRPRALQRLGAALRSPGPALARRARTRPSPCARRDGGAPEDDGVFEVEVDGADAPPGTDYFFVVPGRGDRPDPTSRHQPRGPHGPSRIVDPRAFAWTDGGWRGRAARDFITYELHVGTFTPDGTFDAAIERLPAPGRARRDRGRADAGRRVPRHAQLGLRRRQPLRAAVELRRPRRAQAPGRRLPRPRPRA